MNKSSSLWFEPEGLDEACDSIPYLSPMTRSSMLLSWFTNVNCSSVAFYSVVEGDAVSRPVVATGKPPLRYSLCDGAEPRPIDQYIEGLSYENPFLHHVEVTGLVPGVRYRYSVGGNLYKGTPAPAPTCFAEDVRLSMLPMLSSPVGLAVAVALAIASAVTVVCLCCCGRRKPSRGSGRDSRAYGEYITVPSDETRGTPSQKKDLPRGMSAESASAWRSLRRIEGLDQEADPSPTRPGTPPYRAPPARQVLAEDQALRNLERGGDSSSRTSEGVTEGNAAPSHKSSTARGGTGAQQRAMASTWAKLRKDAMGSGSATGLENRRSEQGSTF